MLRQNSVDENIFILMFLKFEKFYYLNALYTLSYQTTLFSLFFGSKILEIRLVGEDSNSGLLEILYLGQWATVCIGKFDNNAAKVVCRMLGKPT